MRDVHGRYRDSKELTELAPTWAHGCGVCERGLVNPPALAGVASLYMERLVQAIDHLLTFCTCQAGTRYRSALLNRRRMLVEEAKRNPLMAWAVERNTHPDIESTRRKMHAQAADRVPTMHFEPEVAV